MLSRFHNFAVVIFVLFFTSELSAQYQGLNIRGDIGLKSGTQPLPGVYFVAPLFYRANYSGVRDPHGNQLASNVDLKMNFITTPAIAAVAPKKILGARYGAQFVPAVVNQRMKVAGIDQEAATGYGYTDLYIQPISLGWEAKRADFVVGYGMFIPTGENRGLDMWVHEFSGGSTIYLTKDKMWHASALASFDLNGTKKSQDIKPGRILTVEGGAGRSFLKGAGMAGISYVGQWKLTHDQGSDIPAALPITNGRVFGVGPEAQMPVLAKGSMVVLLGFRYQWEFGGRTTFQGQNLVGTITVAKIIPPH